MSTVDNITNTHEIASGGPPGLAPRSSEGSSSRWPTTGRKQRAGSRAGQSQPNRAASLLPLAAVRPRHVS